MIPNMKQNKHMFCSHLCGLGMGVEAQPPTPTSYLLQDEAKANAEGLLEGILSGKGMRGGDLEDGQHPACINMEGCGD